MPQIRVTKQFDFEAAHALWNYDGKCKNVHGHSYKLFVTVIGEPIAEENNPKNGMVLDFGDLKGVVKEFIVDVFDHALVLNKKAPNKELQTIPEMFDRLIFTDYQPTCENMVRGFAEIIREKLPSSVSLFSVRLYETETSFAEWFAEDNQ